MERGRSRVRLRLIFLLFVLSSIAFLDRTNISVAGVQMREEYQLDQVHLGWIFSAFLIGYAAFQAPAGWLGRANRAAPRAGARRGVVGRVHGDDRHGLAGIGRGMLPQLIVVRLLLGAGEARGLSGRQSRNSSRNGSRCRSAARPMAGSSPASAWARG